jgi:hypothetical protein
VQFLLVQLHFRAITDNEIQDKQLPVPLENNDKKSCINTLKGRKHPIVATNLTLIPSRYSSWIRQAPESVLKRKIGGKDYARAVEQSTSALSSDGSVP